MDLEKALDQFNKVEANVRRLDDIRLEVGRKLSQGDGSVADDERYRELRQVYSTIRDALPSIGGHRLELSIPEPAREPHDDTVESGIDRARECFAHLSEELDEYRVRMRAAYRALIRDHMQILITDINSLLIELMERVPKDNAPVTDSDWKRLVNSVNQVERLAGSYIPRRGRWGYMQRHIAWGQGEDVHDIGRFDWPSVRAEIENFLYSELEPIPVEVSDLASLAASKPTGPVTTKLSWQVLSSEEFERLLFNLVSGAPGYTNVQWLTHTNAPDRGRDLSAERIVNDSLSGTKNVRVIIQAKHWLAKSVGTSEVSAAVAQMALWEHPIIRILVIATSGRFTQDAVAWVEKHNDEGNPPAIELWPDSQLELLLAERPRLAAEFGLR